MTVWRFVDGKIAEEWVFVDELDLYRQLGLFKEPASTGSECSRAKTDSLTLRV
jgi:hypothetical protein